MRSSSSPDVLIAGAGLIGLSLALELERRGATVTVLESGDALGQASTAAAGMLAANDPHNPQALSALAHFSLDLYPAFLRRLAQLSGTPVPFQTDTTLQYEAGGRSRPVAEHSLDPRQLAAAVLGTLPATAVRLFERLGALQIEESAHQVTASSTETGKSFRASVLVHASGAWTSLPEMTSSVAPRKGQMLRVRLPPELALREVHRDASVYVVPRTVGPQAGSALIGATLEDAGFDLQVHAFDLGRLRRRAARLLPQLADEALAPQLEAWAGLRPATPDLLPLLGPVPGSSRQWMATGHFRNGILLAPATAQVMADLLQEKTPCVSLLPFSPERFSPALTAAVR